MEQGISLKKMLQSLSHATEISRMLWNINKGMFAGVIFLSILQGLSPVVMLYIMQVLINSVVISWEVGFTYVIRMFVILSIFTILNELVSILHTYLNALYETKISNEVTLSIVNKAKSLELEDFENPNLQDQLTRAQEEAAYRPYATFQILLGMGTNLITLGSSAVYLITWKWWITLLLMVIPLASFISFIKLSKAEFEINWNRASKYRLAWYYKHLQTNDKTYKEVKLYNIGGFLLQKLKYILDGFYAEDHYIAKKRRNLTLLFEIINISVILSLIYFILEGAFSREFLIGNAVGYMQAIRQTYSTSKSTISGLISFVQNAMYLEILFDFLNWTSKKEKLAIEKKSMGQQLGDIQTLEFKNVSFTYPGTDIPILKNVSFKIEQGETLAIVGKNGSGKSTIVKLLTKMYHEFDGEILINDIPIQHISTETLYKEISAVFQEYERYEMSVRNNIGFGNISSMNDDDQILRAAEKAGIRDFIEIMPEKLENQLGRYFADGYQLSGGQWQRIAIARAFMRDSTLCILDEPSAALDPISEKEVFETFKQLMEMKMGIFISHRYSSVRFADKILVMEDGYVAEFGIHNQLLHAKGLYAELYDTQVDAILNR